MFPLDAPKKDWIISYTLDSFFSPIIFSDRFWERWFFFNQNQQFILVGHEGRVGRGEVFFPMIYDEILHTISICRLCRNEQKNETLLRDTRIGMASGCATCQMIPSNVCEQIMIWVEPNKMIPILEESLLPPWSILQT